MTINRFIFLIYLIALGSRAFAFDLDQNSVLKIQRNIQFISDVSVMKTSVCMHDLVRDYLIKTKCEKLGNACCFWSIEKDGLTISKAEVIEKLKVIEKNQAFFGTEFVTADANNSAITAINVKLAGTAIEKNEIEFKITQKLLEKFNKQAAKVNVEIVDAVLPSVLFSESNDWDVVLPPKLFSEGLNSVKLVTKSSAFILRAKVQVLGQAYVALKNIPATENLVQSDFELRSIDLLQSMQYSNAELVASDQFPQFSRTRNTILKDRALLTNAFDRQPLVKFGDLVTLILQSDNIKISTQGLSRGTAAEGEMVSVQVQKYNKSFRARVTGDKKVEVWL